jgi:transcriptional regulator of arginine metabolism
MKRYRQQLVLELIEREAIHSQEQLLKRLHAKGVDATQATVSRDIKELGLVKRAADGAYARNGAPPGPSSAAEPLRRAIVTYLVSAEQVENLLVLRTPPSQAQPLGSAIDLAELSDIAGTVAGDDTVLVIARTPAGGRQVLRRFEEWRRNG